jgi:hypothetical protein
MRGKVLSEPNPSSIKILISIQPPDVKSSRTGSTIFSTGLILLEITAFGNVVLTKYPSQIYFDKACALAPPRAFVEVGVAPQAMSLSSSP